VRAAKSPRSAVLHVRAPALDPRAAGGAVLLLPSSVSGACIPRRCPHRVAKIPELRISGAYTITRARIPVVTTGAGPPRGKPAPDPRPRGNPAWGLRGGLARPAAVGLVLGVPRGVCKGRGMDLSTDKGGKCQTCGTFRLLTAAVCRFLHSSLGNRRSPNRQNLSLLSRLSFARGVGSCRARESGGFYQISEGTEEVTFSC
jgi:hypothetical protein